MWPFPKKISIEELASILKEALDEYSEPERQAKADWLVRVLEEGERTDPVARYRTRFQNIRAELFRLGVKHSNQL